MSISLKEQEVLTLKDTCHALRFAVVPMNPAKAGRWYKHETLEDRYWASLPDYEPDRPQDFWPGYEG